MLVTVGVYVTAIAIVALTVVVGSKPSVTRRRALAVALLMSAAAVGLAVYAVTTGQSVVVHL